MARSVSDFIWTEASMIVGYARTSTEDQEAGLEAQHRDLSAAGCERVFSERVSSAARRAELENVLAFVRVGDTLVVTKPDRLARSVADLLGIIGQLEAKGVALRVLSMGGTEVSTTTPTGRLMLMLLGAVAEFERALMLERQREGIAKAKAAGRYRGRAPTAWRQAEAVRTLHSEGVRPAEIARRLSISRSSAYAILRAGAPAPSAKAPRSSR
jgi:DNA invertase Pin-like site-specific DNA recombinase